MRVLISRLYHNEADWKDLLSTEISKKPMTRLTNKTFTSRISMDRHVIKDGSIYFAETLSAAMRIVNRKKSASVQQIAIVRIMGISRFLTTDPLGNSKDDTLITGS